MNTKTKTQNKTRKRKSSVEGKYRLWGLFDQVDNTSLTFFRSVWGIIMSLQSYHYIMNDFHYLENDFMRSDFYPKYYGFDWITPLSGFSLHYIVCLMFLCSIGISLGACYHISSFIFFLCRLYLFLLDASLYSDQQYFILLISFLLIFIPANTNASIDSFLFPSLKKSTVSSWCIRLLQFQQVRTSN